MLSYLRGTIQAKEMTEGSADRLVVEVAGVGFDVTVSRRTLVVLGQVGDEITVHTALSIRENDWTIFGFASAEEREMFALVQSVSGVGPKLALGLVGTLGPRELAEAIVNEDTKMVSQAPGVGAKMAQRLILELKSKVEDWSARRLGAAASGAVSRSAAFEEVRSILEGLGYTPTEINGALKSAEAEKAIAEDVEQLVRFCLKALGAAAR